MTIHYGDLVFNEELETVAQLCFLHHHHYFPDTLLDGFIVRLCRADHLLAFVAIQEALASKAPERRIEQAQRSLAEGDTDAGPLQCSDAISDYRQAWERAVSAQCSSPTPLANGHMQLDFITRPSATVLVQASTNLVEWVFIGNTTADSDGVVHFEDKSAATHTIRFYRILNIQQANP